MAVAGTVREWHDEEGWGVVDSPETPGGCWTHLSHLTIAGFGRLSAGQIVELEWESPGQDGFPYRAVRAWPAGEEPVERRPTGSSAAYRSSFRLV
jgi:CspA family cold shock protein